MAVRSTVTVNNGVSRATANSVADTRDTNRAGSTLVNTADGATVRRGMAAGEVNARASRAARVRVAAVAADRVVDHRPAVAFRA
jgi:hypothetical protein